jgi:F420H(2)-dependent quinone reductase
MRDISDMSVKERLAQNRRVVEEFRAKRGNVEGSVPLILLTTTGAKSGQPRLSPLIAVPFGDTYLAVASLEYPEKTGKLTRSGFAAPQACTHSCVFPMTLNVFSILILPPKSSSIGCLSCTQRDSIQPLCGGAPHPFCPGLLTNRLSLSESPAP